MKTCGASWEIALQKSQYSLANELCTFCPAASFSRFSRRERKGARERERVGKRHRQRVRLNYEKRLCILSRALPQTFASIMHTPTQSACGTQLHWRYQREREREGDIESKRGRESCAPAARTAPFCQTSKNSLPHGKFDEFPAVFKHFGWFAWLGSLATLIAS